ncbi:hypothetical protein [Selenomonas sp. F0473]|uniref:hypothetical protein n=1 Tax=Selenomonas sp. F0473 TaxID=999423 RepID=UPI00029E02A7|nr:hypothetical protein [Selenomonas sp. F0473]EKU70736.1 hypothetical protein HMPREF9161_01782 [Selenomonas sp. F0473]
MENVYALVKRFYGEHGRANIFVPRPLIERYLRGAAWKGRSNEELCADWYCIEDFLAVILRRSDELARLLIRIDYLALFFRYAAAHIDRRPLKRHVEDYFSRMRVFLAYLEETGDYETDMGELDADLEEFYITGRFRLPEMVEWEEIEGLTLEDIEEDERMEMEELNLQLNNLLHKIGEYFRRPPYQLDIGRAAMIYTGERYDMNAYEHASEEEKETFWLRFWDFFFFDYHLIATDETPIAHYSEQEWDKLDYDEREIVRDLLAARFAVLAVTEEYEEHIVCRDILRDEEVVLPHPDLPGPLGSTILFGHICDEGMMMLNYITSIPASKRLQRRISETIHREHRLFRMQKHAADMDDFLLREAALVRHTIHALSSLAQLDVLPQRALPHRIERPASVSERCKEEVAVLRAVAEKLGFSRYAQELMAGLFLDYAHLAGAWAETPEALTAVIFLFAEINRIDLTHITELYRVFGSDKKTVGAAAGRIRETLGCVPFDPRYLGEEGFVTMLYTVVNGK